jgi:polygalacturonase
MDVQCSGSMLRKMNARQNQFSLSRSAGLGLLLAAIGLSHAAEAGKSFNVRDYGATGNGVTLDTIALNQAIEACAKAGGGQVRIPPGRYLSGTIQLCSHLTLFLAAGATIVGTTNLDSYTASTQQNRITAEWRDSIFEHTIGAR